MKPYAIDKTKHLSDREYDRLHKKMLDLNGTHRERDATLILTSMYTGARPQEVLNIRAKDLSLDEKSVFIYGLKKSDNREIPVPDWLFKRLLAEVKAKLPAKNPKIFEIGYQRYNQIWKDLGLSNHTLKSLRHTFAVRNYKRSGHDLNVIQSLMGHRSIQNTIVYAKYQSTMESVRKALGL